jgi:hypothetical protein
VQNVQHHIIREYRKKNGSSLPKIKGASGNSLETTGTIRLPVKIGKGPTKEHHFFVVKKSPYLCILGTDYLSRLGKLEIDFDRSTLTCGMEVLKAEKAGKIYDTLVVANLREIRIPPKSETIFNGYIESSENQNGWGQFEPYMEFKGVEGIFLGNSVIQRKTKIVPITAINPTDREFRLHEGQSLGVITKVEMKDIKFPKETPTRKWTYERTVSLAKTVDKISKN